MWFCFTAIGFISALVIIVSLWEKFQTNPTITGKCEADVSYLLEIDSTSTMNTISLRFIGLDMDVHNQQIVFPTIVVCPVDPFDGNRTNDLAYSYLG